MLPVPVGELARSGIAVSAVVDALLQDPVQLGRVLDALLADTARMSRLADELGDAVECRIVRELVRHGRTAFPAVM